MQRLIKTLKRKHVGNLEMFLKYLSHIVHQVFFSLYKNKIIRSKTQFLIML